MMKPIRNNQLEAFKIAQDMNSRLCREETKLEAYKARNKDLTLLNSILIAENTNLMQKMNKLSTMCPPPSSGKLSVYETQV